VKSYKISLGLTVSSFITFAVLPGRISEGQMDDLYNLIGSTATIWVMCFTAWILTGFIQKRPDLEIWQKILISMQGCAFLSTAFYYTVSPFFEDILLQSMPKQNVGFAIFRVAFRGLLLGAIIVPILFYLENIRALQKVKRQNEIRRSRDIENHSRMLEQAVRERTMELEQALLSLEMTQKGLSDQLQLQIWMVASISHDIKTPFQFAVMIIKKMNEDMRNNQLKELPEYALELEHSLVTMHQFLTNILAFTRTQFKSSGIKMETVTLADVVEEKTRIFQGIIASTGKELLIDVDPAVCIVTNRALFSVILHNLIDNANKHTIHGMISIYNVYSDSTPHLIVENTGNTMPGGIISWVNGDALQDTNNPVTSRADQGIGLILVKEIAELLNIKVFIETRDEKTKFHLILPVQEDADLQNTAVNQSAVTL
jgi:signal transduction histidine kinase